MALAVVYLLPGPDMILLLQTGARQGKGAALATAVGLGIARGCHVVLAALGLAALFKAAPWTFDVVRLVGAAYLLWIGIQCLRTTMLPSLNGPDASRRKTTLGRSDPPRFADQSAQPQGTAVLLGVAAAVHRSTQRTGTRTICGPGPGVGRVGLLFDSAYALTGAALGRWLQRSPGAQRLQQWLFGSLLIGFAVRLTFVQQA